MLSEFVDESAHALALADGGNDLCLGFDSRHARGGAASTMLLDDGAHAHTLADGGRGFGFRFDSRRGSGGPGGGRTWGGRYEGGERQVLCVGWGEVCMYDG